MSVALAVGIFLLVRNKDGARQTAKPEVRKPELFDFELAREIDFPAPESPREAVVELPRKYGRDRLVLMARDPYWLYAYWEVSAARQDVFSEQFGPAAWPAFRPMLRVYDITGVDKFNGGNAQSYVDIPVSAEADSWHIEVGQADRTFCVDLGRVLPTGEFVTLLRSNVATTPRATISDRLDEEWMWLEDVYRSLTRMHTGVSSPLLIEEMRERMGVAPLGISSPEFIARREEDN
ncbi:MAG: DUF4912 domain-containing protein [Candidatus Desulforudis sp.]|nr:DUF4912 domain-containing protein [Desulforudis sp.]